MKRKITSLLAVLGGLLLVPAVYAQNFGATVTNKTSLGTLFCNIIEWFVWVVIFISVIMVLYAAYSYATARDDTEKTSRARKTITYAAVGIAVALIAYGFPSLVAGLVPGANTSINGCMGGSSGGTSSAGSSGNAQLLVNTVTPSDYTGPSSH